MATFHFLILIFQFEHDFRAASYFASLFAYLHIVLGTLFLLVHKDREVLSVEALEAIAHLDALDGVGTEYLEGYLIEDVLNVLNAVEVPVVVEVAVEGLKLTRGLGSLDTHSAHTCNGTGLVATVGS